MAEMTPIDPLNDPVKLKITKRQSISTDNHINRIRSRRLTYFNTEGANTSQSTNLNQNDANNMKQELTNSKSSQNSVTIHRRKSSVTPDANIIRRQSTAEENHIKRLQSRNSRRLLSISPKPGTSEKQNSISTESENVKNEDNKSRNSSVSNTKTGITPAPKIGHSTSNEQLQKNNKQTSASLNDNTDIFDQDLEVISADEKIFTSKDTQSSRNIVLAWLHGISCPLTEKKRRASTPPETKKHVQNLKKSSKSSMKKKVPDNTKSKNLRNRSKSPTTEEKSSTAKAIGKLVDNHSATQNSEVDSTIEVTKEISDVETHVSEQGKLQIIFDAKYISPDDAAIVIGLDDIPETVFPPGVNRR